jgi:hypothetical protein
MARDFAKADVVINNVQKVIGTYHAPYGTTLFFPIGEEEYNTLVAPLLVGIWDVPNVDQLEMFYYWKSSDDGDGVVEPSFYITENTDVVDDIPRNYNKTPNNGGPSREEGDKIYNALRTRLEQLKTEYEAAEAAKVENTWREWSFRQDGTPLNMKALKSGRTSRLTDSDWTQMPDSPLSDDAKASWATYRQELRDLPAAQADPYDPDNFTGWPTEPS